MEHVYAADIVVLVIQCDSNGGTVGEACARTYVQAIPAVIGDACVENHAQSVGDNHGAARIVDVESGTKLLSPEVYRSSDVPLPRRSCSTKWPAPRHQPDACMKPTHVAMPARASSILCFRILGAWSNRHELKPYAAFVSNRPSLKGHSTRPFANPPAGTCGSKQVLWGGPVSAPCLLAGTPAGVVASSDAGNWRSSAKQ